KSYFHIQKINYLGFTIKLECIKLQKDKIEAIRNWLVSRNIRDIRFFLEYINFYK
ncbi:hypothetical protein M406DRAFT_251252, partial [Cryphonectria parasitica EP155]